MHEQENKWRDDGQRKRWRQWKWCLYYVREAPANVLGMISVWNRRHNRAHRLWWNGLIMELYVLVKHQVRRKVKHPAVDVFIGPPSQGKHHHSHPWVLDDSHLVIHVEVSETWVAQILLLVRLSHYCSIFETWKTIIKPWTSSFILSWCSWFLYIMDSSWLIMIFLNARSKQSSSGSSNTSDRKINRRASVGQFILCLVSTHL